MNRAYNLSSIEYKETPSYWASEEDLHAGVPGRAPDNEVYKISVADLVRNVKADYVGDHVSKEIQRGEMKRQNALRGLNDHLERVADLEKQNARLKEQNEHLRHEMKRGYRPVIDDAGVKRTAREILQGFRSKYDRVELACRLCEKASPWGEAVSAS